MPLVCRLEGPPILPENLGIQPVGLSFHHLADWPPVRYQVVEIDLALERDDKPALGVPANENAGAHLWRGLSE